MVVVKLLLHKLQLPMVDLMLVVEQTLTVNLLLDNSMYLVVT
jgi:hypothetical protein